MILVLIPLLRSVLCMLCLCVLFFFKQKTAYEMRIIDWSSDVCSSDLLQLADLVGDRRRDLIGAGAGPDDRHPLALQAYVMVPTGGMHACAREAVHARSEERRVGKECVSTCRSRWSPYH